MNMDIQKMAFYKVFWGKFILMSFLWWVNQGLDQFGRVDISVSLMVYPRKNQKLYEGIQQWTLTPWFASLTVGLQSIYHNPKRSLDVPAEWMNRSLWCLHNIDLDSIYLIQIVKNIQ